MSTKTKTLLVIAMLGTLAAAPLPAAAQWGPPGLSPQSEERAHPRLVEAIHHMQAAYHLLQAAPEDFGGRKAQAMQDTQAAIHSLKRALYYRLNADDQTLDRWLND